MIMTCIEFLDELFKLQLSCFGSTVYFSMQLTCGMIHVEISDINSDDRLIFDTYTMDSMKLYGSYENFLMKAALLCDKCVKCFAND